MKFHIIQPTHYEGPDRKRLFKTAKLNLIPLTLPYLAALLPADAEVVLTDERTHDIDFDSHFDCVLITLWTLTSYRAYDIAAEYRRRGVPVVMGGPHCYFHVQEVLKHADAVAIGEGEELMPRIVEDLANGDLKKEYRASGLDDLGGLALPRRELLNPGMFGRFPTVAVQTSRGCPNRCEFCSERFYLGEKYRTRPVDDVIEEINRSGKKRVFFADSTFAGIKGRTMELMEKMVPLGLRWSALWTTNRVLDLEFMRLARRSGLLHINLGVESIKQETLDGMNKRSTKADTLEQAIKILRDLDISFSFNLIFGWDTERIEDLQATLEFLERHKVHVAFFNIFCPHKGTVLYDRFVQDGRLRHTDTMDRFPGIRSYIEPKNFSAQELEDEIRRMYRRFYSWPSILRRLPLPMSVSSIASWTMNLGQRKMATGDTANFDGI